MLVSISGPPMSGKTTLYQALRLAPSVSEWFGVQAPDIVRKAIETLGIDLAETDRRAFQHFVGFSQLVAEEKAFTEGGGIFDKSLLDAIAYWDVLIKDDRPAWASELTINRYDLVILCSYQEIPARGSSVDLMHAGHREQLSNAIKELASEYARDVVVVSGTPAQRLQKAREAIRNVKSPIAVGA